MIRPSKFRNVKTATGFDSKKEERRWHELCLLQKAGKIHDLKKQVPFEFVLNGVKICKYKADFVYTDMVKCKRIVEDVKGYKTPMYRLKKKLLKAFFGYDILET